MGHKLVHTASVEQSLKQTPPEPHSGFDLGETTLSTPKGGHRANK